MHDIIEQIERIISNNTVSEHSDYMRHVATQYPELVGLTQQLISKLRESGFLIKLEDPEGFKRLVIRCSTVENCKEQLKQETQYSEKEINRGLPRTKLHWPDKD